jgi:hypothetical protein
MASLEYKSPPLDTNADDARSLYFESRPLDSAIEYTGTGDVTLCATSTTANPLFVVRIVDVSPDGTATLVSHGHHQGENFDAVSTPRDVEIRLKPASHVFDAGQQIRVAVSAAYFPRLLPSTGYGSMTVRSTPLDPATVTLPRKRHETIVSCENPVDVPPVDRAVETSSRYTIAADSTLETRREHNRYKATARTTQESTFELPHGALMEWQSEMEKSVLVNDPKTLSIAATIETRLNFAIKKKVTIESPSRATHETAQLTEKCWLDDRLVFERTWRR